MGLFAALFTAVRADSSPMGGELGFCVYAVMHRDVLLLSLGDEGFVLYIYIYFLEMGLGWEVVEELGSGCCLCHPEHGRKESRAAMITGSCLAKRMPSETQKLVRMLLQAQMKAVGSNLSSDLLT